MKTPKNCWDYMGCGQRPGNPECNGCPALDCAAFDGINRGKNGGRFCWCVAGTLCGGKQQGGYKDKIFSLCLHCPFFRKVQREEGRHFVLSESDIPKF